MNVPLAKVAGVCGWPIHHSLSPMMHDHWLRRLGISGAYIPFMVKPWEAVEAFRTLPQTRISGVNVTLPLKESAFVAADSVTEDAQRIGAVNCLYVRDGRLIGHNTDMEGFAAPLLMKRTPDKLNNLTALVLGAGGASKAVIAALLDLGVPEIILTNRTDEKAQDLCRAADLPSFYAVNWDQRQSAVSRADLIINTTAAGMSGFPALDIDLSVARSDALIYDLIYTPEMTPFLAQAQTLGLDTLGGLSMLIAQARPSFKLFFGQEPPAHDISGLLRRALATGQR